MTTAGLPDEDLERAQSTGENKHPWTILNINVEIPYIFSCSTHVLDSGVSSR